MSGQDVEIMQNTRWIFRLWQKRMLLCLPNTYGYLANILICM